MPDTLVRSQVLQSAGVSAVNLVKWKMVGAIELTGGGSPGTDLRYTKKDVASIFALKHLSAIGIKQSRLKSAIENRDKAIRLEFLEITIDWDGIYRVVDAIFAHPPEKKKRGRAKGYG